MFHKVASSKIAKGVLKKRKAIKRKKKPERWRKENRAPEFSGKNPLIFKIRKTERYWKYEK